AGQATRDRCRAVYRVDGGRPRRYDVDHDAVLGSVGGGDGPAERTGSDSPLTGQARRGLYPEECGRGHVPAERASREGRVHQLLGDLVSSVSGGDGGAGGGPRT